MSWRRDTSEKPSEGRGITGFLRNLLSEMPWSEKAEAEEKRLFSVPDGQTFRVHNSNGRTRITGEERDDIEVVAYKTGRAESADAAEQLVSDIQMAVTEIGGRLDLDVEVPRKWNRRGSANLCIKLPREMEVWVAAANGRVEVEGIRGVVRAKSTNGAAKVCDIIGDVEIATTNAKVSCAFTCGKLLARSSNGKIEIDQHRGSVDASTSNGLIRASLEDVGADGVQLATSNGRIVLDLPEVVDADVDIRVDNGVIRSDRDVIAKGRETIGRLLGRLGAGGKLVKLRTSNGSVSLR